MVKKALVLAAVLAGLAPAAQAEDATLIQQLQTARALYDIGVAEKQPLYLLTAARLRKAVPMKLADRKPTGGTAVEGAPLSWEDMLAAAAPLIAGDPTLEGLAEDIRAETSKGVTNGPVYSIVEIGGGGRDVYPGLPFTGGQYAEIYVEGPSGSDLNVLVHDAQGRLVCSDTDISAIAYCGWRPATDGEFAITVVNEAPRGGRYSMMTN